MYNLILCKMQDVKSEIVSVLKRVLSANVGIEPYVFVTLVKSKNKLFIIPSERKYSDLSGAYGYKNDKLIQYLGNYRVCPIIEEGVWFRKIYFGGEQLQNGISKKYRNSEALRKLETFQDEDGSVYRGDSCVSVDVCEVKDVPNYSCINTVLIDLKRARELVEEFESEKPFFDMRDRKFVYKGIKIVIPKGNCTRAIKLLIDNIGSIVSKEKFYCAVYECSLIEYKARLINGLSPNESAESIYKRIKMLFKKSGLIEKGLRVEQSGGFMMRFE